MSNDDNGGPVYAPEPSYRAPSDPGTYVNPIPGWQAAPSTTTPPTTTTTTTSPPRAPTTTAPTTTAPTAPAEGPAPNSKLQLGVDLDPRPGEATLSDEDARQILEKRFSQQIQNRGIGGVWRGLSHSKYLLDAGPQYDAGVTDVRRDLLARIVSMIPIEKRTQSVMDFMDVRPLLREMMLTRQQADIRPVSISINGVPVGPDARVEAGSLLVEQNDVVNKQAIIVASQMEIRGDFGDTTLPENKAKRDKWIHDVTYSYQDKAAPVGPTPELAMTALGQGGTEKEPITEAEQAAASTQISDTKLFDQYLGKYGADTPSAAPVEVLSNAYTDVLMKMDIQNWNTLLLNEAQKVKANEVGQANVDPYLMIDTGGLVPGVGGGTVDPNMYNHPSYLDQQTEAKGTTMRMFDVMTTLWSSKWTNSDIRNLQDKLIAAGYLDDPSDENARRDHLVQWTGAAADPATQTAWQTLATQAYNQHTDMLTLLKNQTAAKREADAKDEEIAKRDIVLTSSAGVRATVNSVGQQVLGRELPPEEQAKVVEFIHSLERKSQLAVQPEGAQETEDVNIEAEVNDWIRRQNPVEADAQGTVNAFQQFSDIARRRG